MRPGRRAPEGDDLPVVLLDDDGARGITTTDAVEVGGAGPRPRRWRELSLVGLAVAVVAAVGLIGGGGDDGDEEPASARNTESYESFRRTSTTGRPPRPTTTTQALGFFTGSGPLLPDLTGTTIGFADSAGTASILDLDTGARCSVQVGRRDTWSPWPSREGASLWVQADDRVVEVDRGCVVTERSPDWRSGWPALTTGDTVWIVDHTTSVVEERALDTNEPTGRSFTAPRYSQVTMAAVRGGIVVSANGEMTLLDLEHDERRSLGTGTVLAGREREIIVATCPLLACEVAVVDIDRGTRRRIADADPLAWEGPSISPDGRFARVAVQPESGAARTLVLDLVEGGIVRESELEQAVFTDDSRWLIGIVRGDLQAVSVDGRHPDIPIDVSQHTVRTIGVLRGS